MAPAFERSPAAAGPVVRGYGAGGFLVEDEAYPALLLTPHAAIAWEAPALDDLAVEDLEPALGLKPAPEFLILGTGATQAFPPRALIRALDARGIGIEAMDSRAAARVWGVLRGEDRWIAAALMPL